MRILHGKPLQFVRRRRPEARVFYTVRQDLMRALCAFGTIGPDVWLDDRSLEPWLRPTTEDEPAFFVVEYDSGRLLLRVEPRLSAMSAELLLAVSSFLRHLHPQWAVGFAVEKGYILVTSQELVTDGRIFRGCADLEDVARTLEHLVAELPRPKPRKEAGASIADWLASSDPDAVALAEAVEKMLEEEDAG